MSITNVSPSSIRVLTCVCHCPPARTLLKQIGNRKRPPRRTIRYHEASAGVPFPNPACAHLCLLCRLAPAHSRLPVPLARTFLPAPLARASRVAPPQRPRIAVHPHHRIVHAAHPCGDGFPTPCPLPPPSPNREQRHFESSWRRMKFACKFMSAS